MEFLDHSLQKVNEIKNNIWNKTGSKNGQAGPKRGHFRDAI